MPIFECHLEAKKLSFAIVISRFNPHITEALLASALDGFRECGANEKEISIFWVPGAYEIPTIAKQLATSKKYDAILTLGCIIRGETVHFDLIATCVSYSIQKTAMKTGIPIIFSILATENTAQAEERIDAGRTGALACVEMANLVKSL